MYAAFEAGSGSSAVPVYCVAPSTLDGVIETTTDFVRAFVNASSFRAKPGQCLVVPKADGQIDRVFFGIEEPDAAWRDPFRAGQLPALLPPGVYRLVHAPDDRLAALAFALGTYRFSRYKKVALPDVKLVLNEGLDGDELSRIADAVVLARDLINTPANDMGPEELAGAAEALAERFGASFACIVGDDLLNENFPLIHAVGKASSRAPRLIDFSWGDSSHPKVTLVGKGVCFDTGGVDLKPAGGMLNMKKDMGGAANVLALAQMIMSAKMKVRLRVLIPAVENSVGGNAFRPLDVYPSRKGDTVEIGNTDAEGRLVLADALTLAGEDNPDLLIDLGTLTGAARVALGPDLPPFYTRDEALAADVARCAQLENDPLWRLPLWPPYDTWLDSKVANINNAPSGGFAGSITCALFLGRFVDPKTTWLHVDIFGWTPSAKPARPEGGECQAARAIYRMLVERYG